MRKTSLSVKHSTGKSLKIDKKEAHNALAVDGRSDYNPQKMKEKYRDRETYPSLLCNKKEFQAILDTMLIDRGIKLPRPYKTPSRKDRRDPRYYCYHQYLGHPCTILGTPPSHQVPPESG
ncbi:hypothetical protein ACFX2I_029995 [Malus domestica]